MLINGHFGLFLVHFLVFQFERLCSRTFSSSSGDLRPHVSCVFGEMAVKRGGSIPCHDFPCLVLSGTSFREYGKKKSCPLINNF